MRRIRALPPLQLTVLLLAVWWLPQGPVGFLLDNSFATGRDIGSTTQIGPLPLTVNGWHALLHLLTALAALAVVRHAVAALWFAVCAGAGYIALGLTGLVWGSPIADHIAVDTFGSAVHLAEGVILLSAAAVAAPRTR